MAQNKPSVWRLTGANVKPVAGAWTTDETGKPMLKPDVKPEQNALSVTASTIVKNDEPLTGHVINLTVAHMRSEGFAIALRKDGTATITRTEEARGRNKSEGIDSDTLASFLTAVRS